MAAEAEWLRRALEERARRSRPHGQRVETAFPVRNENVTDMDPRDNALVTDITGIPIVGLDL